DREELRLVADQLVVVRELEPHPAPVHEAVADRVAEQGALGVVADVNLVVAAALGGRARDHRPVVRQDGAAVDLLLLQQRPAVRRVGLERVRVEDRPVRREPEEEGVEDQEEAEELDDLPVHWASASPSSRARRRALSEIISSSASRMKLATIELPP